MAVSKKAFENLLKQARQLPTSQKRKLIRQLEDRHARTYPAGRSTTHRFKQKLGNLGGILEGYDFTEEEIAQARKEMWGKFGSSIG